MKTLSQTLPIYLMSWVFSYGQKATGKTADPICGAWYLRGVMETGSGFLFRENHRFEFFFSYGAVDRTAIGEWTRQGDSIILNNAPGPPRDFRFLRAKKTCKSGADPFLTGITKNYC